VGAWPYDRRDELGFSRRVQDYAVKMAREAKVHTSWVDPDEDHERALRSWVRRALSSSNRTFREDFLELHDAVAVPGAVNALTQVLLKVTAPGVPDLYQGTELWHLALVDPDNRRPVDFDRRIRLLRDLDRRDEAGRAELVGELLNRWRDGRIKLHVTATALRFRRTHPELYARGAYIPLRSTGRRGRNVVAFARRLRESWAITVVPRLVAGLAPPGRFPLGAAAWGGTAVALPEGAPRDWTNVLTGEPVQASEGRLLARNLFATLPEALIASRAASVRLAGGQPDHHP
jgi:(1->4)-alpha-D-glucan 1-alpha-D-glucosylmutase